MPTDISPPAKGVDHRHVQKELGEVIVRLHNPVVLSPTTIQATWTVSKILQIFWYSVIQWWAVEFKPLLSLKFAPGSLAQSLIPKSLHNWCTNCRNPLSLQCAILINCRCWLESVWRKRICSWLPCQSHAGNMGNHRQPSGASSIKYLNFFKRKING